MLRGCTGSVTGIAANALCTDAIDKRSQVTIRVIAATEATAQGKPSRITAPGQPV
jgi:hypothetical protein